MLNKDKYQSLDAAIEAFQNFCRSRDTCDECYCKRRDEYGKPCGIEWLYHEEEIIEPCPFCGSQCELHERWDNETWKNVGWDIRCTKCEYRSPEDVSYDGHDAIKVHNRVAKAVQAAKRGERK